MRKQNCHSKLFYNGMFVSRISRLLTIWAKIYTQSFPNAELTVLKPNYIFIYALLLLFILYDMTNISQVC